MLPGRLAVIPPLHEVGKVESSSSTITDNKVVFCAVFSTPAADVAASQCVETEGRNIGGEW